MLHLNHPMETELDGQVDAKSESKNKKSTKSLDRSFNSTRGGG